MGQKLTTFFHGSSDSDRTPPVSDYSEIAGATNNFSKCLEASDSDDTLPVFSYIEVAEATNNFGKRWGEVGFSVMYYGKLRDGRQISVEKVRGPGMFQLFVEKAQKMTSRLSLSPHRNLVSIYGYTSLQHNTFLLVHEYMSSDTLYSRLDDEVAGSRTLPWLTRLDIAIDIANALAYLHNHGIIYKDVKSKNILLGENFCAKLTMGNLLMWKFDGSISAADAEFSTYLNGMRGYVDPEYDIIRNITCKSDIYSFGVVLVELLSSTRAVDWRRDEKHKSFAAFASTKFQNQELDELLDPMLGFQSDDDIKQMMTAVADLASRCLQLSGEHRPSVIQVLDTLKKIRQGNPELLIFSYHQLEDATCRFDNCRCLGKGAFGIVYHGKLRDGREIAVKRFIEKKDIIMQHFKKEIDVLSLLRHRHLLSLYGYSADLEDELILVYEYMSNGNLATHLRQHSITQLPWLTRLNIAIETASALVYLHNSGIIHRDVKASNILLDKNFSVKVADFGLSRFLPPSDSQRSSAYATHVSTAPQGTYGYMDPEYIASNRVSDKSDVYSFGVILFELISSKPPAFMEGPQYVTLANFAMNKILNKALEELVDPSLLSDSYNKTMEIIAAVAELAFQCVQCPKEFRPSMKEVLETLEGIKHGTWGFKQIT